MTFETWLIQPAVQSLGRALLHFVWQGALLAAVLFVANAFIRRSQARLRYATGCAVMLLMPVVFVATIFRSASFQTADSSVPDAVMTAVPRGDGLPADRAIPGGGATVLPRTDAPAWYRAEVLPGWMVCLWLAGVAGLSMYTAGGWLGVRRLKRRGIEPVDPAWVSTLESLMGRLQVSRPVQLYLSAIAQVPAVIGWVRPYILLPVSALTGLDEAQLRAVLAHELAHIRRYDYLANLLQNAVETLLFYHPAVWWVSRRIREERENCCDDLAVAVCGDVMVYAGALARLEELRGGISEPALAATGGDLLARVRRLVGPDADRERIPGSAGLTLAAALVLGAMIGAGEAPQATSTQSGGAPPAFEVASVKVNPGLFRNQDPGPREGALHYSPDTLTIRGMSLWLILRWAYGVGSFQMSGPAWIQHMLPRYDILAKAPGRVTQSQLRLMLQTLLAQRFHLAVHREKKEMPVTALLVAKGGPKFHESTGIYDPARGAEMPMQFLGFDNNVHMQRILEQGRMRDSFTDMPMSLFAIVLELAGSKTPYEKVPVVDMTGLRGRYDFVVVMDLPARREGGDTPPAGGSPPDDILADFQRILPKELGLTLEHRKAMVDVLVIDHADKEPTPN